MTATVERAEGALGLDLPIITVPNVRTTRGARWRRRLRAALVLSDALVIAACLLLAGDARGARGAVLDVQGVTVSYFLIGVGIGALWLLMLEFSKSRHAHVVTTGVAEYKAVIDATFYTFGTVAIAAYLLQAQVSRSFFLLAIPVGLLGLLGQRWLWRNAVLRGRGRGQFVDRVLVVGNRHDVAHLAREVRRQPGVGFHPVAVCYLDGPGGPQGEDPLAGFDAEVVAWAQVADWAVSGDVAYVVVAGEVPGGRQGLRRLGWGLEGTGVDLVLLSELTDVAGPRMHLRPLAGLPLVYVSLPRFSGLTYLLKRAFDVAFAAFAILLITPLLLLIAVAIKIDDRGPVLFRQVRVGAEGRAFTILKFRTMCVDAEARLAELAAHNEGAGPMFKLRHDPRITRVGRFLRKTSLDELPQFFNALGGSMSVVGPRPPLPSEVVSYDADATRRLLIRPGITGLWQVSGRNDLSWEESIRLDLSYVENWSISGDLAIIGKTMVTMVRRSGAY